MTKNKAFSALVYLSIFVMGLLIVPTSASADHYLGVHWAREANSFGIKVGNNAAVAWRPYLDQAVADWSQSSVFNMWVTPGQTDPTACRPTDGQIAFCVADYGVTNWGGLASFWTVDMEHITMATALVNQLIYNNPMYTPDNYLQVVCHELGHVMGLNHIDENWLNEDLRSCLDFVNYQLAYRNKSPNAHDYEELEHIYDHLDRYTTIARKTLLRLRQFLAFPPAGDSRDGGEIEVLGSPDLETNPIDPLDPKTWGKVLHTDETGRGYMFEREITNDKKEVTKIVTIVDWLP